MIKTFQSIWLLAIIVLAISPIYGETVHTTSQRITGKIDKITGKKGKQNLAIQGQSWVGLKDVVKVEFPQYSSSKSPSLPQTIIALNNGDFIYGDIVKGTSLDLVVSINGLGMVPVSLDNLQAVFYPEQLKAAGHKKKYLAKVLANSPKKDVVYLKKGGQIPCVIQSIEPGRIKFQVSGVGNRVLKKEELLALRIAPLGGAFKRGTDPYVQVYLKGGTSLSGQILSYENDLLNIKYLGGKKLTIPYGQLLEIYFFHGTFTYLSDIKPQKVNIKVGLSTYDPTGSTQKALPTLRPRFDKNSDGLTLQSKGKKYRKGIALHSTSRLTYALNNKFLRFQTFAAFDDATKEASTSHPFQVVFRIYGDGKKIYDSGPISTKAPRKFIQISVDGVKELVVEVASVEEWDDVLGRLNLLDAVLVKK